MGQDNSPNKLLNRGTNMNFRIFIAKSAEHFEDTKQIITAYSEFLGIDLSFQDFSRELEKLNVIYSLPTGSMILAEVSGEIIGGVGLRHLCDDVAEMKRLFVQPKFQGNGLGRLLIVEFLTQAKKLGYKWVRLDTIPELDSALSLYKKHGFKPIEAYRFNPHPNAVFMELAIS